MGKWVEKHKGKTLFADYGGYLWIQQVTKMCVVSEQIHFIFYPKKGCENN